MIRAVKEANNASVARQVRRYPPCVPLPSPGLTTLALSKGHASAVMRCFAEEWRRSNRLWSVQRVRRS